MAEVFRINKTMSNYHLQDKELSFKAKGLFSCMLSLPDDWNYSVRGLALISKEGIKAINSILKELEENSNLKMTINFFQNLFNKLVNFIKKKLFKKSEDRENYMNFSKDLYEHGIFDENTIKDISDEYRIAINGVNKKQRDDLER